MKIDQQTVSGSECQSTTGPRGDIWTVKTGRGVRKDRVFVTDFVQLIEGIPYKRRSLRIWILQSRRERNMHCEIRRWPVLLAKEETVLQGMIARLIEIGKMLWNENEWDNLKGKVPIVDCDRCKTSGECEIF
jgi:hypothetical protein